jgi:BirA family transcriptional regulator, biotin operon repressor / biotin---[acetyl-CoA-carboxylase] ligase
MKLDPRASAAGVRLIAYDVLGSTNAEALHRARQRERGPLWITAARQTAGRGRRGRAWISPPGNLYASLLLTAPAPVEHWPQLSFVATLATHDAIVELAPRLEPMLAIKWPNDLLVGGAKCAGILVEGEGFEQGAVAIGIGVNCASHPADMDCTATDLASAGELISPEQLLVALSSKMLGRLAQWNAGNGFSTIWADWLARISGRGEDVTVRLPDREVVGHFEALDATGALVLRLPDGTAMTIAAGDLSISTPSRDPVR